MVTLTAPGQTVQRTNQPETAEAMIRLAAPFIEKSIVMVNETSFESLGQVWSPVSLFQSDRLLNVYQGSE